MSRQSASELLTRVRTDAAPRGQLDAALDSDTPIARLLDLASAQGYDFDAEELAAALAAPSGAELDEAELDTVVAGGLLSYSSFLSRTLSALRSYTTAPTIKQIGTLGGTQEIEEELAT